MPLVKREITPVFLSRQLEPTSKDGFGDLDAVTNYTLSSIILQLSNLSKHAEDIFGELYYEADSICKRSNVLQERVDRLSETVTKLDATKDDVSLQDIQLRKAFKSSFLLDQEVVAARTMPSAMRDTYMLIDKPPKLNILSQYRDDGKEALKFYTDPKYFFELWRKEIEKNIHDIKVKKRERKGDVRRHKVPKQQKSGAIKAPKKKDYQYLSQGQEFQRTQPRTLEGISHEQLGPQPGQQTNINHHQQQVPVAHDTATNNAINDRLSNARPMSRPPAPPEAHMGHMANGIVPKRAAPAPPLSQTDYNQSPHMNNGVQFDGNYPLPPPPGSPTQDAYPMPPSPPPPIDSMQPYVPPAPPLPDAGSFMNNSIPPPPPPPPPPGLGGPGNIQIVPPPPPNDMLAASVQPVAPPAQVQPPKTVNDPRSALLTAIENYKSDNKLRKVEVQNKSKQSAQDNSVEAILSRRIAVEQSDSEDDESSYDSDGSDWGSD